MDWNNKVIQITKDEAKLIREQFPTIPLPKTCKLKNKGARRGKTYIQETSEILKLIEKIRK